MRPSTITQPRAPFLLGSVALALAACTPAPPATQAAPAASAPPPASPPTAAVTAAPIAAPSAAAANDGGEGDESLVGLLGTYRVTGHVAASVSALSEKEANAVHRRDVVIQPALRSPWDTCAAPEWTHKNVKTDAWLQSWNAPSLSAAQKKVLGLKEPTLTLWEAACGAKGPRVEIAQTNADTIVVLHDGVAFAATRRGR